MTEQVPDGPGPFESSEPPPQAADEWPRKFRLVNITSESTMKKN